MCTLLSACIFKYFQFEGGIVLSGILGMFSAMCTAKIDRIKKYRRSKMTWTLLLTLAAIVLINRYFFLEPKIALRNYLV
jgi:hypothetical protein